MAETGQTEEKQNKQVNVYIPVESYEQLIKIQAWYRSPSITHTVKLMLEDITKGLETGEFVKMVRRMEEQA